MVELNNVINISDIDSYLFSIIDNNLLYFTIIIVAIIVKIKENSKRNMFSAWLSSLIGTIAHEMMHFIAALLTNGKPTKFSIFPSKQINKDTGRITYTLGYVYSKNFRWYNVFIISMAPLLLLPLSFYVYENFFIYFERNLYTYIIYIFTIISLLFSSIPSGKDFSNVFKSKIVFLNLIPFLLIVAGLMYVNFKY